MPKFITFIWDGVFIGLMMINAFSDLQEFDFFDTVL